MKLYTISKYWIVEDKGRNIIFESSSDAWRYIFLMREIRPKIHYVKELYPVKSLSPFPNMNHKKIKWKCIRRVNRV